MRMGLRTVPLCKARQRLVAAVNKELASAWRRGLRRLAAWVLLFVRFSEASLVMMHKSTEDKMISD